jgi:predicted transcriptional regulator
LIQPPPTDREIEILKILWDLGEGSVREVHERLSPAGELHFNTVQTQLRILDKKGLVAHRREGRTLIYRPLYSREQESSRFLRQVFDGELDQLVLSMLAAEKIKPETLDELEQLIKEARKRQKHRK